MTEELADDKKQLSRHILFDDSVKSPQAIGDTTVLPAVFSVSVIFLPVSDLTGRLVFWSVLLVWRELLFPQKGGWLYQKGGWCPLFPSKRGPVPPF
jgi:hypothetical protein